MILEKRKLKELEVLKNLKVNLKEKKASVKKFNEHQEEITQKMRAHQNDHDRKAYGQWRNDV